MPVIKAVGSYHTFDRIHNKPRIKVNHHLISHSRCWMIVQGTATRRAKPPCQLSFSSMKRARWQWWGSGPSLCIPFDTTQRGRSAPLCSFDFQCNEEGWASLSMWHNEEGWILVISFQRNTNEEDLPPCHLLSMQCKQGGFPLLVISSISIRLNLDPRRREVPPFTSISTHEGGTTASLPLFTSISMQRGGWIFLVLFYWCNASLFLCFRHDKGLLTWRNEEGSTLLIDSFWHGTMRRVCPSSFFPSTQRNEGGSSLPVTSHFSWWGLLVTASPSQMAVRSGGFFNTRPPPGIPGTLTTPTTPTTQPLPRPFPIDAKTWGM